MNRSGVYKFYALVCVQMCVNIDIIFELEIYSGALEILSGSFEISLNEYFSSL